tara:strand:+ start:696 stop:1163 length:468 start_codon:yes stop_codon:yes gene_type:complete
MSVTTTNFQYLPSDVLILMIQQIQGSHTKTKQTRIAISNMNLNYKDNLKEIYISHLNDREFAIVELYEAQDIILNTYDKIIREKSFMIDRFIVINNKLCDSLSKEKRKRKKLECFKTNDDKKKIQNQTREQRRIERKIYKFILNPEVKEFIPSIN